MSEPVYEAKPTFFMQSASRYHYYKPAAGEASSTLSTKYNSRQSIICTESTKDFFHHNYTFSHISHSCNSPHMLCIERTVLSLLYSGIIDYFYFNCHAILLSNFYTVKPLSGNLKYFSVSPVKYSIILAILLFAMNAAFSKPFSS